MLKTNDKTGTSVGLSEVKITQEVRREKKPFRPLQYRNQNWGRKSPRNDAEMARARKESVYLPCKANELQGFDGGRETTSIPEVGAARASNTCVTAR